MSIYSPLKLIFRYIYDRLINNLDDAYVLQEKIFFSLIDKGTKTLFGFDNNFKKIKSIEDYNRYVPINKYEQLFPYIDIMIRGEQKTLWTSKTKLFLQSGGQGSSKVKYIPISPEGLKENYRKAERDMIAIFLHNYPDSDLLRGKNIFLSGSISKSKKDIDLHIESFYSLWKHDLMIYKENQNPNLLKENFFDWNEKIKFLTKRCIDKPVSSIIGKPDLALTLLNVVMEEKGVNHIEEVWPTLEVFFHGWTTINPYKKFFNQISRRRLLYQEIYTSPEGFFAIQLDPADNDMLLLTNHGIFYEFVEHEDFIKKNFSNILTLKDVKENQTYDMIITTNSGLWRYVIGDSIEFTYLNPFKIKIVGRSKNFINIVGEELLLQNVEEALSFACQQTNSKIENYTAGPKYFNKHLHGCHEWAIEFITSPDDIELFAKILDEKLQSINPEYKSKRYKNIILGEPLITVLPSGFFSNWLKKHETINIKNKIPRLYNSRKFLDDIHKSELFYVDR